MHSVVATVGFIAAACSGTAGNHDAALDTPVEMHDDAAPDSAAACPPTTIVDPSTARELAIVGDAPAQGIFDPSIVYPRDATAGAMAYSAVPGQDAIRTHLAVSSDHGATWTFVAEANVPEPATIASSDTAECPAGACTGSLISETSSLVFDADEPDASRRWKLFAHRYLVGAGAVQPALHYRIGTIALQTAPAPNGPWSAPQKLIGWSSPAAFTSTGIVANINTIGGTTGDCVIASEPGALWLPGAIDLAVGCVYLAGGVPLIRIELLRSTDHAASWTSVGTLLRPEEAACLTPGASLNGANLFAVDGHAYLAATPSDATGYHGCLVYEIDDIAAGHVARGVHRMIAANQFSGACTFADGAGGYALDIGFLQSAHRFRVFSAGVTAP